MNFTWRMIPKHRQATLGLLVATSLSLYLVVRLVQASTPAATTVHLSNLGPAAVTVTGLSIRGESALTGSITLPPAPHTGAAAEGRSHTVDIAAGLPIDVHVQVLGQASPQGCTMDPRPQGACVIRARLRAGSDLQCGYECKVDRPD